MKSLWKAQTRGQNKFKSGKHDYNYKKTRREN